MVIAEITAGIGAIKAALEVLKDARDLKGKTGEMVVPHLQTALIDAQRALIAADQTHSSDVQTIRELETEVARLQQWNVQEKTRYELKDVHEGAYVFALKQECAAGEPPHWLCTNCFQKGQKSFMQAQGGLPGGLKTFKCVLCENSFRANTEARPRF